MPHQWSPALAVLLASFSGCVNLPNDVAVIAPAAAPVVSNAVHCNCVVNKRTDKDICADPSVCPGPRCPCPEMDMKFCLPADLNLDTATDPIVRARLVDPGFDFAAAVEAYCAERADEIMMDIGAVSEHAIICDGKSNSFLTLNVPSLVNCHAVGFDGRASSPSTSRTAECAAPCPDRLCINGPKSERPNANCDGDDVFTWGGLHPEACRCNRVPAGATCRGPESEVFCSPNPVSTIQ